MLLTRLAEVNAATPQDYRRLDTLFHLSIAELTGSSLLATACADARMRLNDLLNAIPVLRRNIDHTAGQHTAIVVAILAGEADAARMRWPSTWRARPRCYAPSWPEPGSGRTAERPGEPALADQRGGQRHGDRDREQGWPGSCRACAW